MKKKQQEEKCVAIRLSSSRQQNKPSSRYILWIDDRWYETTSAPAFVIPESQIGNVKAYLQNHFQYYATFIHQDGTEESWSAFTKPKPKVTDDFIFTF